MNIFNIGKTLTRYLNAQQQLQQLRRPEFRLFSLPLKHAFYFSTGSQSSGKKNDTSLEKMNYYELLQVRKDASPREIKSSFIQLAKTYHPDVYKGPDVDRFKFIKIAYQVLKKPQTRRQYDESQESNSQSSSESSQSSANSNSSQDFEEDSTTGYTMDGRNGPKRGFSFDGIKDERTAEELQKEYEKFFSKGVERPPEHVVVYEDILERQLSMDERIRHEYAYMKNNEAEMQFRFGHQQPYQKILQDNIELMNKKAEATDSFLDFVMKKREIKLKKMEKLILIILIAIAIPFTHHILERRHDLTYRIEKSSQNFLKYEEANDVDKFHDRLQYDYKTVESEQQSQQESSPSSSLENPKPTNQ